MAAPADPKPPKAKPDRAVERSDARGTQSNPENPPEVVTYTREELTEAARHLLGVSPHAVAGGLADSDRKTFTLDDATALVNDFLGREVVSEEEVGT